MIEDLSVLFRKNELSKGEAGLPLNVTSGLALKAGWSEATIAKSQRVISGFGRTLRTGSGGFGGGGRATGSKLDFM